MPVPLDKATIKPGTLIAVSDKPRTPFGIITGLCMHRTERDTTWCGRYKVTRLTGEADICFYEYAVPLTQEDF